MSVNGKSHDVVIGGQGFRMALSQDLPYGVETIPTRKDQLDIEPEPGEQSISDSWWRRSQDSFHGGAGAKYQETRPLTGEATSGPHYAFESSQGIDVFDAYGQAMLYRPVTESDGIPNALKLRPYSEGTFQAIRANDITVYAGVDGSVVGSPWPVFGASDGRTQKAAILVWNRVYELALDGLGAPFFYFDALSWPLTATGFVVNHNTSSPTAEWEAPYGVIWGKYRPWAFAGNSIWQPDTSVAVGTAQDAIFVCPTPGWRYTSAAEGPSAMYFAGHDGYNSAIHAVELDASGGVPTINAAREVVSLPAGEVIYRIAVAAGQYMAIATSRGIRIGTIGEGGSITYGPLLWNEPGYTFFQDLCASGNTFAALQTGRLLYVDVSQPRDDNNFPWVMVDGASANIRDMTLIVVAGYPGQPFRVVQYSESGLYFNPPAPFLSIQVGSVSGETVTGSLTTGRIRFHTQELKLFRRVTVYAKAITGSSITVKFHTPSQTTTLGTITTDATGGQSFAISAPAAVEAWLSFELSNPPSGMFYGPELYGYQLKALPAVKPERIITFPLLCYDHETDQQGQRYGHNGFSEERLAALQALEDAGDTISFTDYTKKNPVTETALIDSIQFVQNGVKNPRPGVSGKGGILVVRLRTVNP